VTDYPGTDAFGRPDDPDDMDGMHLLTGAYALDALDTDERAAFEAHLATCPACAQEVREFHGATTRLAVAETVTPSRALKSSVMDEISRTRQLRPLLREDSAPDELARARGRRKAGTAPAVRRWKRISAGLAAAACVLAAVGLGLGLRSQQLADERDQATARADQIAEVIASPDVQTTATDVNGANATLVSSPSSGDVVLVAQGLSTPPENRTYQLWLIDPEGQARSAGTFDPDSAGDAAVLLAGTARAGDAVGLTLEPTGGSTAPTTTPLFAVPLPT